MTTIMLTMIGIILAAATALMVTFYGGDGFLQGSAKAQADTLLNAGANVRSASNVYMATRGRLPKDPAALVAAGALQSMPSIGDAGIVAPAWQELAGGDDARPRKAYAVSGVSDDVCRHVNRNLVSAARQGILKAPEGLTGCFETNGNNVFYAMLSDAGPERMVSLDLPGRGSGPVPAQITDPLPVRTAYVARQMEAVINGFRAYRAANGTLPTSVEELRRYVPEWAFGTTAGFFDSISVTRSYNWAVEGHWNGTLSEHHSYYLLLSASPFGPGWDVREQACIMVRDAGGYCGGDSALRYTFYF